MRRGVRRHVGRGINEHLRRDARTPRVAERDRDRRREVPARRVTADREPRRVDTEGVRVRMHPVRRSHRVVERGGELVLRRQAVAHRHHRAAREVRELAARHVVRVEVADRPPAPVEEDEHRQALVVPRPERPIESYRDVAYRPGRA
jgi:hypothetical protein